MPLDPAADSSLPDEFGLGDWRVRLAEGTLSGPGRQARLEPKVAALLGYLVRHRERMVPKEELLDAVWADAVVAPVALARAVSELRRALDDHPKVPRYIETFPKRGYRLVAPVHLGKVPIEVPLPPSSERVVPIPPAARAPIRVLGLAALALTLGTVSSQLHPLRFTSGPPALVVLPFRALDPRVEELAAALTETVYEDVVRVGDLRVLPRGRTADDPERGAILEGTVASVDGRVRILARLLERAGSPPLWTETFERAEEGAAGARSDVAARIVHGLRVHGLRARQTRSARERSVKPAEPTAYELFRLGRGLLMDAELKRTIQAQAAFERSLALEPQFTLGRTGLALALAMRAQLTQEPTHARAALAEAETALAADPNLPEAHHALGRARLALGHYRRALQAHQDALRLRPDFLMPLADRAAIWSLQGDLERAWQAQLDLYARDYAPWRPFVRARLGACLLDLDLRAEARPWLESALQTDPLHPEANATLARLDVLDGNRRTARERVSKVVGVDPSCGACVLLLGQVALLDGDLESARRALVRAIEIAEVRPVARLWLALVEEREGRLDRARSLRAAVETESRAALDDGSESREPLWNLAAVAASRRDASAAAMWCGRAIDAGWRDYTWVRIDPAFAEVRREPGLRACLARAELAVAAERRRVGPIPSPSGPAERRLVSGD